MSIKPVVSRSCWFVVSVVYVLLAKKGFAIDDNTKY